MIVLLDSWYNWGIHQLVLSTIIGSTTIGVLYLLRLIVNHIFPNRDKP